jgi:PHD/YefM family antitoxin component YafN of YafNO toxin-antitoxin module
MKIYSVEYWQEHWEELMDRVESGESIAVENSNGQKAVMTIADEELIRIHTTHDDAS